MGETFLQSTARAELNDVALVNGRVARVVAIGTGLREITFEFIGGTRCPTCGREDKITLAEGCLLWQLSVRAVTTCGTFD